jgi:hypothetical protein
MARGIKENCADRPASRLLSLNCLSSVCRLLSLPASLGPWAANRCVEGLNNVHGAIEKNCDTLESEGQRGSGTETSVACIQVDVHRPLSSPRLKQRYSRFCGSQSVIGRSSRRCGISHKLVSC